MTGRHHSPPPVLRTGWRWHTVAALAGLGILAPPVTLWAEAVAPDATARSQVSTVTRAERTDAGPLVLPTVGASGAWSPPEVTVTENALNRPVPSRSVRTSTETFPTPEARRSGSVAIPTPSDATHPTPTPTVTPTPADAPPPTVAAAEDPSSATPTPEETPAVTPEPTEAPVTVDVTAEVGTP